MTRDDLVALALLTIRAPQEAARQILSVYYSRDVLWSALALVGAVNSIIFSVTTQITGPVPTMPAFFNNPLAFFLIYTGMMVMMVHAFYWTGRAMGGVGDLGELLALTVWLQALRAVAQVGLLVLLLLSPALAFLYSIVIGLLGVWILLSFVSVALRLNSLGGAFAVLVVGTLGLALGLVVLGSMIGLTAMGVSANV